MNCAYCEERLSDYLENTLPAAEREALDSHFLSCPACTALKEGVREVMQWGRSFPAESAPEWLPARIVANTPTVIRITWGDWLAAAWRGVSEPRFAMSLLTSVVVIGWMGSLAGFTASDVAMLRHPAAIYGGVQGWMNRAYGDAVRLSSPVVNEIQCQIHTRLEQFRENS
jgi:anti-sigma factor RsiW